MATFMVLTRLSPEALADPAAVARLEKEVSSKIKTKCPSVKWLSSYVTLGPYDYVDIYEAPDEMTASKVALIIRSFGHATTETWALTPWRRYLQAAESLAEVPAKAIRRRKAA